MGLFTIQQAAPTLHISEATLRRIIRRREIGYRQIGRRYLFRQEDIDHYIESTYKEPRTVTQGVGCEIAV